MGTRLTVEKSGASTLLCTLEFSEMGNGQSMRFTMEVPTNPQRSLSGLELQVMQQAHSLLGEMCSRHPANKSE